MTPAASCFPGTFRLLCPVADSAYAASRESTRVLTGPNISKNNHILFGINFLVIIAKMCVCIIYVPYLVTQGHLSNLG